MNADELAAAADRLERTTERLARVHLIEHPQTWKHAPFLPLQHTRIWIEGAYMPGLLVDPDRFRQIGDFTHVVFLGSLFALEPYGGPLTLDEFLTCIHRRYSSAEAILAAGWVPDNT